MLTLKIMAEYLDKVFYH